MLRRSLCASLVLLAVGGIVLADTIRGVITEVKDGKISVNVLKGRPKKGERPEVEKKTFTIDKSTKIAKQKGFGEKAESTDVSLSDLEGAVKAAAKGKGRMKGVFATIETDGEKATKISYRTGGGRRGKTKETKE
jgi:hypothetical protein